MERLLYAYFPLSLCTLRIVPTTSRMSEFVGTFFGTWSRFAARYIA